MRTARGVPGHSAGLVGSALSVGATASHPLGRTPPLALRFVAAEDGGWRSVEPLAEGRQRLDIRISRGTDEARYRIDLK